MGRAAADSDFVRATEARRLLGGLSEDTFYDLVRRRAIPSLLIGSRSRVYPRGYIAALARYCVTRPGLRLAEVDPADVLQAEAGA